jgi:hypothetical protein
MVSFAMIYWDTCKQHFKWDGSWRDIYVAPASLNDWEAIFPFLRVQQGVEFLRESRAVSLPEALDASFFSEARPTLRFRVGGVLVVFHFFTPEEIECDIDPREVTGQASLDAVLAFMRQLGDLTRKRVVLTPENGIEHPIISYDSANKEFEYHEVTT